jgi:hypothetical protein
VCEHEGLEAVMQCILDATSDADDAFLLQAFECLSELGGAEAARAKMAEEGTASLVRARPVHAQNTRATGIPACVFSASAQTVGSWAVRVGCFEWEWRACWGAWMTGRCVRACVRACRCSR